MAENKEQWSPECKQFYGTHFVASGQAEQPQVPPSANVDPIHPVSNSEPAEIAEEPMALHPPAPHGDDDDDDEDGRKHEDGGHHNEHHHGHEHADHHGDHWANWGPQHPDHTLEACKQDWERLCPNGGTFNEQNVFHSGCLKHHKKQVSPNCRGAMKMHKAMHSFKVKSYEVSISRLSINLIMYPS
jgi:hypothetical protein